MKFRILGATKMYNLSTFTRLRPLVMLVGVLLSSFYLQAQDEEGFPSWKDWKKKNFTEEDQARQDSLVRQWRNDYETFLLHERAWRDIILGDVDVVIPKQTNIPSLLPLDKGTFRISSPFGMRTHPVYRRRKDHHGVDLARIGTASIYGNPVYATASGRVARAEVAGGYGNYIMIIHGPKFRTAYAHLSLFAVKKGESVKAGQVIGYVGSTGRSTGPHLHYEVIEEGRRRNPELFFP